LARRGSLGRGENPDARLLPGWTVNGSVFGPASPQATEIVNLFWLTIIVAVIIFAGVSGVVIYSAFAHRERPGREAARFRGNGRLEVVWTAAPTVLLAVILTLSVQTMNRVTTPATPPLEITVVGHQWWWELRYDGSGVTTANELHVPVGQPILLHLQSADVIHSFWIPRLAGKTDLVPGHSFVMTFTADQEGTYEGQCSEFCGVAHAWMLLRVIAKSPADFAAWTEAQRRPATAPSDGAAIRGSDLFLSQPCLSCHAIEGTPAVATIGPNLTHMGSRATIAAGVLANTPENMALWLADPDAVKPGSLMPNFRLTPAQASDLAAYLESLR
jgi:cytochrome c oxidase subunit 2